MANCDRRTTRLRITSTIVEDIVYQFECCAIVDSIVISRAIVERIVARSDRRTGASYIKNCACITDSIGFRIRCRHIIEQVLIYICCRYSLAPDSDGVVDEGISIDIPMATFPRRIM